VALRVQAERLIEAYVAPNSDRLASITHFDGPATARGQRLAAEALDDVREKAS
jgi:hypothetical protein